MGRPRNAVPTYLLHRASGQARIKINGKDIYLGKYGSPESKERYRQVCAELDTPRPAGVGAAGGLTVGEVVEKFMSHAQKYYRNADREPTSEVKNLTHALKPVLDLYKTHPAIRFGPLALKAVREVMVKEGICRTSINARVNRIRRVFKWAASEELIPVSVHQALTTVTGLKRGRTDAPEREPVKPVDDSVVDKTVAKMLPLAAAMILVMRLTGMRPGQTRSMKAGEIDRTTWVYTPGQHKTAYLGKVLPIQIGPKARAILEPLLAGLAPDDVVFTPARLRMERYAALRANRKSKVPPSQKNRAKPAGQLKRAVPPTFTKAGLMTLVRDACEKAGVPHWRPGQLRHTFASEVRRLYGLEAAQVLLGHSQAIVTQIYAERDQSLAARVAAEIG